MDDDYEDSYDDDVDPPFTWGRLANAMEVATPVATIGQRGHPGILLRQLEGMIPVMRLAAEAEMTNRRITGPNPIDTIFPINISTNPLFPKITTAISRAASATAFDTSEPLTTGDQVRLLRAVGGIPTDMVGWTGVVQYDEEPTSLGIRFTNPHTDADAGLWWTHPNHLERI